MCDALILYFTKLYGVYNKQNQKYDEINTSLYNDTFAIREISTIINNKRKEEQNDKNKKEIEILLIQLNNLIINFNVTYKTTSNTITEENINNWFTNITSIFNSISLFYKTCPHKTITIVGGSTKLHILGRLRKITVVNRKKYITYKNEKILLTDARKLDKLNKTKNQV
jgi:hypothetical protein